MALNLACTQSISKAKIVLKTLNLWLLKTEYLKVLQTLVLPVFFKRLISFFSDMEKSANPHMKHAIFKWFLHNRKNDIRRF
jgi:hypothetical protein